MSTYLKDPDATLDYSADWSQWLDGDTIVSAQWIAPTGITVESSTNSATVATVWLSGGEVRRRYTVTCRVTTAAGRVDDRSITIDVAER